MDSNYTVEKNVQILLSLLKQLGIRKMVASPGTTNFTLLGSMQSDPYFEMYSSVDERSAAYLACGLAAESGEPVMLSCTGATASRNYYPGLTEAYYRKLPVLALTSHQGNDRIGHLIQQNVDRRRIPTDIARISVDIPEVKDQRDFDYARLEINKALLELWRDGGGPVHINYTTTRPRDFSVTELPHVKCIRRYFAWDELPEIPKGKIGVYVGAHCRFTEKENEAIENFCATHDAVVFCDHTSGYYGKYKILPTLALMQNFSDYPIPELDLMIHIGQVSAAIFAGNVKTKSIWRVNPDGEIRDSFKKLDKVFEMPEDFFFNKYSAKGANKDSFLKECKNTFLPLYDKIPELPFSNIWIAQHLASHIPAGSLFHISASHSRRAWNIFPFQKGVETMCNVGACGIDGCTSTLIGASLFDTNRLCYLVTGDLAFFYDLNVLGNRHVGKNVRILLNNNGIGGEFKLKPHPCCDFGEKANAFMAAEGHFGHKSPTLVKHYAEDLGYRYLTASNKEEFLAAVEEFISPEPTDKPIIFEVFTNYTDEDEALGMITNIDTSASGMAKKAARQVLGDKTINKLKSILGK